MAGSAACSSTAPIRPTGWPPAPAATVPAALLLEHRCVRARPRLVEFLGCLLDDTGDRGGDADRGQTVSDAGRQGSYRPVVGAQGQDSELVAAWACDDVTGPAGVCQVMRHPVP